MQLMIDLLDFLAPYGTYAYVIMFAILLACGFGFPMPEDIVLVTGGILSSQGITDFWMTNAVCMAGVLLGDGVIFTMGKQFGPRIKQFRFVSRVLTPEREKKISQWFARFGEQVVFIARFAPGLRMPVFMSAGIFQVSYWKFFVLDGLAALISVPAWIWLGNFFGSQLDVLEEKVRQFQYGLYGVLGFAIIAIFLAVWGKKRFQRFVG